MTSLPSLACLACLACQAGITVLFVGICFSVVVFVLFDSFNVKPVGWVNWISDDWFNLSLARLALRNDKHWRV